MKQGRPKGALEMTGEQIQIIIEGAIEGDSYSEIAEHASCSKNTVYRCRRDLNLI